MKYLIDTHILIWFELPSPKLKSNILAILTDPTNEIYVSQVSLFEIAVKQNIGKTPDLNWDTKTIVKQIQKDKFDLLNIQNQHIQQYITLPFFDQHKDPFDRLIIATAISENLSIISADEKFKLYTPLITLIEA